MSFDAFLDTSFGEYCVPPKWVGPNRERLCPRLVQRIDLFNLISDFGSAYVLSGETPTKRAKNLDFLIKTAKKLSELRCFDPLYALISGCQRSEILRLSKTRDALSSGSLATLDELASLFDSTQNYAKLDAEQSKGKCLPYLGMFLKKVRKIDLLQVSSDLMRLFVAVGLHEWRCCPWTSSWMVQCEAHAQNRSRASIRNICL